MDLLYVVGGGSRHNNAELRYSLRSIEKNCTGYDRVFIVGQKPDFVTNVEFYPCDDPYDCTHKNMMHKILYMCHNSDISEDFVMQGDDHFYVKPYDFRFIRLYEKGDLPIAFKPNEYAPKYRTSMIDTRKLLMFKGYPCRNGSQHCGMWFKKSLFLEIEDELLQPSFAFPYGIESSTIMINAMAKHFSMPIYYREDRKVRHFANEQELLSKIGDNFCFSIYDAAFDDGIGEILDRWFPNKSRWEI